MVYKWVTTYWAHLAYLCRPRQLDMNMRRVSLFFDYDKEGVV